MGAQCYDALVEASLSFLKTSGVLLGLWLALLGVAAIMGVVPPEGHWVLSREAGEEAEAELEAAADAEAAAEAAEAESEAEEAADEEAETVAETDEAASETETAPSADVAEPAVPAAVDPTIPTEAVATPEVPTVVEPTAPTVTVTTHAVCPEPSTAPSLAVLHILGPATGEGARPEVIVGCGDTWHLLAFGTSPVPGRVARIVTPLGSGGLSAYAAAPVSLDFDGDGHNDLALPFVRYGAGGATSGGGLYVLRHDGWNALGQVRALAPIAAAAVAVGAIDSRVGDDLVAINQANPFARLNSEGWSFSGGSSPRRTAVMRASTGARAVALLDVDLDGSIDVAIASSDAGRLDVFFGNGAGVFARHRTFDVSSASGLAVADLDGDEHVDLIIEATTPALMFSAPDADLAVLPLTEVGALRGLEAFDTDGDGRAEILGFAPPQLTELHRTESGTYEARTILELADAAFGVRRQMVVDLDGDGAREVVVLGTRTDGETRTLELVIIPSTERGAVALRAGSVIANSPWVVEVPLPEAQPL